MLQHGHNSGHASEALRDFLTGYIFAPRIMEGEGRALVIRGWGSIPTRSPCNCNSTCEMSVPDHHASTLASCAAVAAFMIRPTTAPSASSRNRRGSTRRMSAKPRHVIRRLLPLR
jgi:hypothetical protein